MMITKSRFLRAKWNAAAAQLRHVPRALRLAWQASGRLGMAWVALLCVQGLLSVGLVYLSRPLVDNLAATVAGDGARMGTTLALAACIAGALLAGDLARGLADWVRGIQARKVEDFVSGLIHRQSTSVEVGFYEMPEFHDHLHRARDEARYRPTALLESTGGLIQHSVTLVAMAAVLAPYGVAMPLALLASTLPAFVVVLHFAAVRHRLQQRMTADERRGWYYDWLMTSGDTASELRLFSLGKRFHDAYQAVRASLHGAHLDIARRQLVAELLAAVAALALAATCVAWVAWHAMNGEATLGDITLFYLAFSQGQRLMRALLATVGQIYYNVLFLGNLFEFLDLPTRIADPPQPKPLPSRDAVQLRFENVRFAYPGSERTALAGLDLDIPAGRISAIVGANGAGKSTLLKLACRFYDPQQGRVLIDGVDVRDLALEELRSRIAVLFQQPVRYNTSVAENIALAAAPDRAAVEAAARAAGAEEIVARLPQGYATLLGRWFDGGTELSVGEWQRLALARALMRRAPLMFLDEPTSAMDSWAESDWLRRLREVAHGRTAVIITHRFTTAMQADVIHVMAHGRITESGSHAELLMQGGSYARSWRMQMQADTASIV